MIFSLQKRFLVLLLLPVAIILITMGTAGFFYARGFLLDQWIVSTGLRLEKAALEISNQLNDKVELVKLIAKAGETPSGNLTQVFLIQQLLERKGVRFVDLVPVKQGEEDSEDGKPMSPEDLGIGLSGGLYTMELCEDDVGFCAPLMNPTSSDRALRIVKNISPVGGGPPKERLVVRIGFDSFIDTVEGMGCSPGCASALVTSIGQFLAHTDKFVAPGTRLGDSGDKLEKKVLGQILRKASGTVFGEGHPPDTVVSFHKIPSMNWYLIYFSKGNEILGPIINFRFYYSLGAVIVILAILVLIRLTTRSVAYSIAEISRAAARVQEGDYSVRVPEDRNDEIGVLGRSFNNMIQGLEQRDLIQRTFGRYVDKSVAEELMRRPEALRLGGEKRTVTIMMADLRNFTQISEKLQPEDVIKILNSYFARTLEVIEKYKGIVVDFYGDSVLVFFDGVDEDIVRRAGEAVQCAIEMQEEHELFVEEIRAEGVPPLYMGIGIHTGEVIVGNIGAESRAKYGIVGSNVNLVARIQATAAGGKIVVSEQTCRALGDRLEVSGDFRVCLKGVGEDKELYEVASLNGVAYS